MTLLIIALGLVVIFAAIGFFLGGLRSAVSLVGIIAGLALATKLAPLLKSVLPAIGIKNPVYAFLTGPVIIFILLWLVAIGIGAGIHHKVALFYKYKMDDLSRLRWERMNRGLGISLGVVSGILVFFGVCGAIYPIGYLTVQLASDTNPGWL